MGATVVVPGRQRRPDLRPPGLGRRPGRGAHGDRRRRPVGPGAPRTADLEALLGPAAARLGPLPLMGPDPTARPLPVVVLRAPDGLAPGDRARAVPRARRGEPGRGAMAVVARGGGTIAEKAAQAAAAGAAALAVWDEAGPASFPAVPGRRRPAAARGGDGLPAGRRRCPTWPATNPALTVALRRGPSPRPRAASRPSPRGGRRPTAARSPTSSPRPWRARRPGPAAARTGRRARRPSRAPAPPRPRSPRGPCGCASTAPSLGPRAVHSLLVQAARPLEGVALERQGAGALRRPAIPPLRIDPPIVAAEAGAGAVGPDRARRPRPGGRGATSSRLRTEAGESPLGGGRARLTAGGRAELRLELPAVGAARPARGAPGGRAARSRRARP